jgi:prevent-host-death family protein
MCYMAGSSDRASSSPASAYPLRGEHGPGSDAAPARVGVRELRQNLSVYLRRVEAGETLEVTEHGRPVARLAPLPPQRMSVLDRLIAEGKAYPGKGGNLADLGPPVDIGPGPTLSEVLQQMRDEDDR